MEQTQKEVKTPKSSSSSYPPWLDLPDPLTELILERLPLLDYLRFAAVCRKWRSIQKGHRLRHSPSAPPMAPSLPFLVVTDLLLEDSPPIPNCYSPFEQTLHRLRLPSSHPPLDFVDCAHGWFLLIHESTPPSSHVTPSLLNPITGHHVLLPPINVIMDIGCSGAISAPPSDPRCAVLISAADNIFLHRLSDSNKWIRLDFPESTTNSIYNSLFHCAGKFYCVSECFKLHVIDPFVATPSMQFLEMDTSQLLPSTPADDYIFQELNGEVLAIVQEFGPDDGVESFILFRADLSKRTWVRMEDIGDQALFVPNSTSFSLLSEELSCKRNSIYFSRGFIWRGAETYPHELWKMFEIFNLETKSIVSEQSVPDATTKQVLLEFDKYYLQWFLPRLDYINSSEASSSGGREESNKMNIFLEKKIC